MSGKKDGTSKQKTAVSAKSKPSLGKARLRKGKSSEFFYGNARERLLNRNGLNSSRKGTPELLAAAANSFLERLSVDAWRIVKAHDATATTIKTRHIASAMRYGMEMTFTNV